jgi:hypothetical protein
MTKNSHHINGSIERCYSGNEPSNGELKKALDELGKTTGDGTNASQVNPVPQNPTSENVEVNIKHPVVKVFSYEAVTIPSNSELQNQFNHLGNPNSCETIAAQANFVHVTPELQGILDSIGAGKKDDIQIEK